MNRKKFFKIISVVILFLAAIFILTARFWEPGGESWKCWAAARILKDTGGFPVFSHGPLYVIYLSLFSLLKFPLSMAAEYLLTHLFTYLAIFFMLRPVLPSLVAFLLTLAWIPALSVIESTAAIAGMGFLALYLNEKNYKKAKEAEYFPLSLTAAALCHVSYLFFLVGNFIGVFIQRTKLGIPKFNFVFKLMRKSFFYSASKLFLLLIVILTILFPSRRWDHNHAMLDEKYSPVSLNSPFRIAFFQIGNWRHVMRTVPSDKLIYQDWYFTNDRVFGGAKTIAQAFLKRPSVVLRNILENTADALKVPEKLFSDNFHSPFTVVAIVFFALGLLGFSFRLVKNGFMPQVLSVFCGTGALFVILFLSWFNQRYYFLLLPVSLLVLMHAGYGIKYLAQILLNKNNYKKLILCGCCLIIVGILIYLWNNQIVLPAGYKLRPLTKLKILVAASSFSAGGILLLIFVFLRPLFITKILNKLSLNNHAFFNSAVAIISASCILISATFIRGQAQQFKAIINNQDFLSGAQPVSMVLAYPELAATISRNSKVLALEDGWIKAFTKVKLNNTYSIFNLPPFDGSSKDAADILNNLDVIWVSYNLEAAEPSAATQVYLRYHLHVAPFLDKALKSGWTVKEIKGFGKVYQRGIKK